MTTRRFIACLRYCALLPLAGALQGCLSLMEPLVVPALLVADTLPPGNPAKPRPSGFELTIEAPYFPYLGASSRPEEYEGNNRLSVVFLEIDGKTANVQQVVKLGQTATYPGLQVKKDEPIAGELTTELIEADGLRTSFKLNIGKVISPQEYLYGGRLAIVVRPGSVIVRPTTTSKCRNGFNTFWCPQSGSAYLWERVSRSEVKYVGRRTWKESRYALQADYKALETRYPPTPELEVAVFYPDQANIAGNRRCLTSQDFSLEINGNPANLTPVPLERTRSYGRTCPRYFLSPTVQGTARLQLTVMDSGRVAVYSGEGDLAADPTGNGLRFDVSNDKSGVTVVRTPRALGSAQDGSYSWRPLFGEVSPGRQETVLTKTSPVGPP